LREREVKTDTFMMSSCHLVTNLYPYSECLTAGTAADGHVNIKVIVSPKN